MSGQFIKYTLYSVTRSDCDSPSDQFLNMIMFFVCPRALSVRTVIIVGTIVMRSKNVGDYTMFWLYRWKCYPRNSPRFVYQIPPYTCVYCNALKASCALCVLLCTCKTYTTLIYSCEYMPYWNVYYSTNSDTCHTKS